MPEQEAERVEFTKLLRLAEECSRRDTDTLGWLVYCHSTLEGHTDDIRCLAISPDGQVLASGSNDNTVRLWDLPDGAALKRLRGHTGVLVTGLPYWEYRKRSALRTLKGHACMVTCLAICPEGQVLASGGGDHTVRLWSLPGGMALQTLKGHTNQVNCVAISPDGRILVSGGKDHTVRLWDLPEGTTVKKLKGFADNVRCLTISPDGRILASGSNDHTIRLWSLPDGTALHTLEGHTQSITCLAISPDGRILVSGSDDHTIRLWSLPDGAALHPLIGHTAGVSCLAISPDGKVLASGGFDRAIRLWIVGKVELSRLIIEQTSLKELKLIQERAQEREVADAEGRWLEFILELMRWQRRFDIEVGEALQKISLGEFDIEIEA
jgi:WD40 repeat protein